MSTLQQIRQRTAKLLHGYEDRGSLAATGARQTTAGGTASSLIEARWPILRGRGPTGFDPYESGYIYRTGVGASPTLVPDDRVRQILQEGYAPQQGKFQPDTDWTNGPAAGEEYELHLHGFDPMNQLTDCINEALKAIMLVVDVQFTPATDVANKGRYIPTLDADGNPLASWLTTPEQLVSFRTQAAGDLYQSGNVSYAGPLRGAGWVDGTRVYLTLSDALFPTTSVWARVLKPAYYHCRASSSAAFGSQTGLTAGVDANEAQPDENWIAFGAVALAWEQFPDLMEQTAARLKAMNYQAAKKAFYARQQDYYQANPIDRTFTRVTGLRNYTPLGAP